jgi:4-hydroxy-tetrahydrodipicolinate synthase
MEHKWEGIFCALWTPTNDQGRLIEPALRDHLAFIKSKAVNGLLVLGSTGEFPHLDMACRSRVMEIAAECAGPLNLIVNVSDIRPAVVAELARLSRKIGAAAISLLPPYFYPVAQEDLVEFFVRAGESAGLPLFLYNFPERTGNRISLQTISAVADRIELAGIKQSGSEFAYHRELVQLGREKNFTVLTGADTRLAEALELGVTGCVSGLANAVPELVAGVYSAARSGATNNAAQRLNEVASLIEPLSFPLDVAAVMRARGLETGAFKSLLSAATKRQFERTVVELEKLLCSWALSLAPGQDNQARGQSAKHH